MAPRGSGSSTEVVSTTLITISSPAVIGLRSQLGLERPAEQRWTSHLFGADGTSSRLERMADFTELFEGKTTASTKLLEREQHFFPGFPRSHSPAGRLTVFSILFRSSRPGDALRFHRR